MNTSSFSNVPNTLEAPLRLLSRASMALAIVATFWLACAGNFAHAARPIGGPRDPAPPLPPAIAGDNFGYFSVRPDLRKCASPLCGGVFVQSVNRLTTRCADGRIRRECYVADVTLADLNLPPDQEDSVHLRVKNGTVLLKGQLIVKPFSPLNTPGLFEASEVWLAATDAHPAGAFFRTVDTGIVCVRAPCLSFQEFRLNAFGQNDIAGVDLSLVGASDEQLALARAALRTDEGILVAGIHKDLSGPAGEAGNLLATQFYLPVHPEKPEK